MSRHNSLVPVDGMPLTFVIDHNLILFYGLYKAKCTQSYFCENDQGKIYMVKKNPRRMCVCQK